MRLVLEASQFPLTLPFTTLRRSTLALFSHSISTEIQEEEVERRREGRLNVHLAGEYARGDEACNSVSVSQLSASGCRLTREDSDLRMGDLITLSLGAVETVDASVVWADGHSVGVQFRTPLDDFLVNFFHSYCSKPA